MPLYSEHNYKFIIMAKIKLSAIGITNISGKSGGSVFAHNKNGNYVRRLGIATQPQTAKQTLARSIFGVISRMWGSLTVEQKEAWKNFGAEHPKTDQFGDSRPLTGRQAFISVNSNLQTIGSSPLSTPLFTRVDFPSVTDFGGEISFDTAGAINEAVIDIALSGGTANIKYVLSVAVVSSGADFGTAKNKYTQISVDPVANLVGLDIYDKLEALGVTQYHNVYLKVEFVAPNGTRSSMVNALMSKTIA